MKKTFLFVAAALLVAGMTVSCGNNAEETAVDSVCDTTAVEPVQDTTTVTGTETSAPIADDDPAMLAAAKEAGQAKCNCYKKDAASVEACIRAILSEKYATYQNNAAFKAAMDKEYKSCIKSKVDAVAKKAGDKAIKAGADALSKKLQNNK